MLLLHSIYSSSHLCGWFILVYEPLRIGPSCMSATPFLSLGLISIYFVNKWPYRFPCMHANSAIKGLWVYLIVQVQILEQNFNNSRLEYAQVMHQLARRLDYWPSWLYKMVTCLFPAAVIDPFGLITFPVREPSSLTACYSSVSFVCVVLKRSSSLRMISSTIFVKWAVWNSGQCPTQTSQFG
jgi:hypothetical protein